MSKLNVVPTSFCKCSFDVKDSLTKQYILLHGYVLWDFLSSLYLNVPQIERTIKTTLVYYSCRTNNY